MCRAKELSDTLVNIIDEIQEETKKFSDKLSNIDLMQSDILHKIELETFNASEGYKLCKLLKNTLEERRDIKNECDALRVLNDRLYGSEIPKQIRSINRNVISFKEGMVKRRYVPRVLKNIMKD